MLTRRSYSFVLIHSPDGKSLFFSFLFVIHLAAFVVAAGNSRRCRRCFSGRSGSDKPLKIARYAIYDDAIIAVRINTNDNGININYRVNKTSVRRRAFAFKSDRVKRLRERG